MSQPNGMESPPYRLVYPEGVKALVKTLAAQAGELGILPAFVSALKGLEQRLRTDPVDLGELRHVWKDAGLEERIGNYSFLFVRFAVDRARYLVYILDCQAIGHGF